ncbi:hypothetical protein FNV43_RR07868 [Rhamnella rubrinervis]|uniref:Alpha-ketoglutarate-dependent dioxygenase AlkB-like domain-containing protein n=1 Tax=Rhamnella rubrinervis TaxID=2594499 RepID=A0A8K0HFH0_9ROSA|nr:hypothetical protein FNV43_RR07868 [Rhamnella rubrinervis]
MVDSIPILYKKQPLTPTAMGTDDNPKRRISKFASDLSSSWSAKNDSSSMSGFTNRWHVLSFPTHFGKKRKTAHVKKPNIGQSYSTGAGAYYNSDLSQDLSKVKGFDICLSERKRSAAVPPLQTRKYFGSPPTILRSGMVHLKQTLNHEAQVEIVRSCRTLGVGPGGFYQPVFKDGAKNDLQMMCLGLNWNPERLTYEFIRSVDGCGVPPIPRHLENMADSKLLFAQELTKTGPYSAAYEDILPSSCLNACIVSFYSAATGRLGLHQDCSERRECLSKGLPVVSFYVGDSAEFLYGHERDVSKAKKVILQSGDGLIFAGKSRHIYHGVSSVIPNSAPELLVEETRLRPGCLNLTFKEA